MKRRLDDHFNKEEGKEFEFPAIAIEQEDAPLSYFIINHQLNIEEYIILLLALMPHIQPNFLDAFIQQYLPGGGDFPEFGGVRSGNNRGMIPTGETALFILADNDLEKRLHLQQVFLKEHFFYKEKILWLEDVKEGEPAMSGRLILSTEWLDKILFGKEKAPAFSTEFPAKKITTEMNWNDLVLNSYTLSQINDIKDWIEHNAQTLKDEVLKRKLKPGYRAMFYGPSGTGKTLTASLLGKQFGKEVYRIDLSQIVSKYIGETEKNLEKIFQKAENKDWILFFDEADALFGKRTNVQNAHDRYANQEVSYLLQRVEDYPGLMILASNFKNNIDDAFMRRLNSIIQFPPPSVAERLILWEKTMPTSLKAEPAFQLRTLSEKFELNGAGILNVVHFAALKSFARDDEFIRFHDLMEGIRREYRKEEKTINH
ncbi:MAG: ATP-binding protein [Ginsengibacter sp.]